MHNVLLTIHILVTLSLVGVILMQRSDGDGVGGLSGGGANAMFSTRGKANLLTRTTAILATIFMLTSLGLAYIASQGGTSSSIADKIPAAATTAPVDAQAPQSAPVSVAPESPEAAKPAAPATTTPAAPAKPAVPTGE